MKKRAAVFSFTLRGDLMGEKVKNALDDWEVSLFPSVKGIGEKVKEQFFSSDALIFVGACGIAVRSAAPLLQGKTKDPAVVVLDEKGKHVISLLSGHMGGANELTKLLALKLGTDPVITTATDVNDRFSVDTWAKKQGLVISSMETAKEFSAEILKRDLPFFSSCPTDGKLPNGLYPADSGAFGLRIGSQREPRIFEKELVLIPKNLCLGIGCKRNTPKQLIEEAVRGVFESHHLFWDAVLSVSSIDVKRTEEGLLSFAEEQKLPLFFFSAEALNAVKGDFTASAFVKKTVGVDNVCERAALLSGGAEGKLLVHKTIGTGVTVAVAQTERRFSFE